jgi:hypothetical protein
MRRYELANELFVDLPKLHDLPRGSGFVIIDRRSFMAGAGATYFSATLTAAAAAENSVAKAGQTNRGLLFTLGGSAWLVDPDPFGPLATVTYRWVDAEGHYHSTLPGAADFPNLIALEVELKNGHFPGFSTRPDFNATLYQRASLWYVRIGFVEAGRAQLELPFAGWCDADETRRSKYQATYSGNPVIVGNINNKENRIEQVRYPVWLQIDALFNFHLFQQDERGQFRVTSKRFQFNATGLRLSPSTAPGEPIPDQATGHFTILTLEPPQFRDGNIILGGVGGNLAAYLDYDCCVARLIGFQINGTRPYIDDAWLQLSGQGTLVCTGPGTGPIGARIQLDYWCIRARANGLDHDAYFQGWVARICRTPDEPPGECKANAKRNEECAEGQKKKSKTAKDDKTEDPGRWKGAAIESAHFAIVIQGEGYSDQRSDIDLHFGTSPPPRVAFNSRLLGAHVPVWGASTGELTFCRQLIRVVLGEEERDETPAGSYTTNALFYIGQGRIMFRTELDDAELRVKRTTDLLDLTFGFRRYALRVNGSVSKIWRRQSEVPAQYGTQADRAASKPLLIVKFEPQYLFEEAFAPPDGSQGDPTGGRISIDNPHMPGLASTRISGKSRIVFSDTSSPTGHEELLSVQYLTDWSNLATVVNKRALRRTASLEDQLNIVGINQLTSRADAKEMIIANTEAPSSEETAVEPVYRLILSPDDTAKWTTNRRVPEPCAPMMWSAALANPADVAVRVLWSRDMDLSFLVADPKHTPTDQDLNPPSAEFLNEPSFVGSLACDDRRQLAEMMSVYGVAALRALVVGVKNQQVTDDPNGMVFLPTANYCALDPETKNSATSPPLSAKQEGFMLGKPFDNTFSLKLSRAATMSARWIGAPPAAWRPPYPKDQKAYPLFFNPAFTIDKYIHETQDGRDTYVEVSYKGFLFPIGHRAALLKVTRREFWPEKNRQDGAPIAYLIQHIYIAVRQPDKTFPAYAQPFNSFDFSPDTVTLKTLRTPDLADPVNVPGLSAVGSVFWPQLLVCPQNGTRHGDALFEYTFDNGATVQSPLLFVDNAAVHDPPSMQNIVQYYMGLPKANLLDADPNPNNNSYLRFAKLATSPVRYAEERNSGECTFKTASWVLGARGWLSTAPDTGVTVTNATPAQANSANSPIRLTLTALKAGSTDLTTATEIVVYGVSGTDEANGAWGKFSLVQGSNPPQIDLIELADSTKPKPVFKNPYILGGNVSDSVLVVTGAQSVTPATPNSPPPIILTLDALQRGRTNLNAANANQNLITVCGVNGTTEANGTWPFTVESTSAKQIRLLGSAYQNPFKSGLALACSTAAAVETQGFGMDAFMEGRDQPPFYPIATKARITVDKVDQLTGRPNTAIEVTFDPNYVRHGFDPANNPSEIFLDVLNPDIQFDPTANTASTGGVATTNSLLVGLARKSGLIGGTKGPSQKPADDPDSVRTDGLANCAPSTGQNVPPTIAGVCDRPAAAPSAPLGAALTLAAAPPGPPLTSPPRAVAPLPPPALQPVPSPYNLASALAGRFDPVEFFGGALKDAKLLGIVPLKDILRAALIAAAPQLMEATDYGVAAANAAVWPAMQELLDIAIPEANDVASAVNTAETAANSALAQLGGAAGTPITLQLLYPDLYTALEQLKSTTNTIAALQINFGEQAYQTTQYADQVFSLIGQFKSNVDAVIKQTNKLAQDPMPAIVQDALNQLITAWTTLQSLVQQNQPNDIVQALIGALLNQALNNIFAILVPPNSNDPTLSEVFELVFGYLDDSATKYTSFPEPAPHTPPSPAQLKQQFAQIIANPADVLPRLQQSLFYESFAQPLVKMLAGVQQLQQEATGTVNWVRTALANQFASALGLGLAAVQNSEFAKSEFAKYGWAILADMEQSVINAVAAGKPIKLGQLPTQAQWKAVAGAAIQAQLGDLRKALATWSGNASKAAQDASDALKKAGQSSDAASQTYQEAMTKWAAAKKCADDFTKLVNKYGAEPAPIPQDTLNSLITALSQAADNEIQSAASDLEAQLSEQAKAAADSLALRLFDIVSNVIDTAIHSALAATIAKAGASLTTLACDKISDGYKLIRTLAIGLVQDTNGIGDCANAITGQLNDITQQLNMLQIPAGAPQDAINTVTGLRAALTRSLQQLAGVILEFEKVRRQIPDGTNASDIPLIDGYCNNPGKLLNYVARCVDLRRRGAQAVVDSLTQINAAIEALGKMAAASAAPPPANAPLQQSIGSAADNLTKSLNGLGGTLGSLVVGITVTYALTATTGTAAQIWPGLKTTINKFASNLTGAAQQAVNTALGEFNDFIGSVIPKIKTTPYSAAEAATLAGEILRFTTLSDRKLVGLLLQTAAPISDIWLAIFPVFAQPLITIIKSVVTIHDAVLAANKTVLSVLTSNTSTGTVLTMSDIVSPSIVSALQQANTQVQADEAKLASLQTALSAASPDPIGISDQAKALIDGWKQNKPGVVQTVQVVQTIVDAVSTGHFATLFNVAGLTDALQKAVADLVPARIRLNYDFDTALSDFPSGDPIFAMDPGYSPPEPGGPTDIRNDLDLRAQVSVNLITGERDVSAVGYIRPFRLHLLGSALDLATIHFYGASFQASPGSGPKFTADIAGTEIGALLAFLQVIEDYLSPSGGNGFYHTIDLAPPQIEVGYLFSKEVLVVGGLIFQNIDFSIGAILPLDGRQAEFQFALASRANPFLISAPPPTPYGGGGFIALRATAQGVVTFEIQLEFGAIFGIQFGPLYATARITAGIYLLSESGGYRVLEGFVQAVGEGNIACFSVAVLIQIKTSQQSDSSMAGSSTYAFKFQISSFFEISYSVTASYQTKGSAPNGGEGSDDSDESDDQAAEFLNRNLLSQLQRTTVAHPATKRAPTKPTKTEKKRPKVRTVGPAMQTNWKSYRNYVDIDMKCVKCKTG